jgi:hypothetical protein
VQVLAELAGKVAAALEPPAFEALAAGDGTSTIYDWSLEILASHGDATFLRLGFSGPTAPVWPDVLVRAAGGPTGGPDAGFLPLTLLAPTGTVASYAYPPDVPSGDMTHRFVLPGRDVARDTFAWGGVWLTRNTGLVAAGPVGPTGDGGPVATNEAFVYRTPVVRFIDPATPLLLATAEIDVGGLPPAPGVSGATIAAHLQNLLYAAAEIAPSLGGNGVWLELTCRYGYTATVAAGRPLYAWMPLLLVPAAFVGSWNEGAYVSGLETRLQEWRAGAGVSTAAGAFGFDLTVLSGIPSAAPPAAAGGQPALVPVLRLENLVLAFASIDWAG